MIEKPPTYNYYFDVNDPSKPFTVASICNTYSLVPENATRIKPGKHAEELIPCWNGKEWYYQFDWRAVRLWEKATGQEVKYHSVAMTGEDAPKYTQLVPNYPFVYWDNNKWARDTEAEIKYNCQQLVIKRRELLSIAKEQIEIFQDVILTKESTGANDVEFYNNLLKAWKIYRGTIMLMKFETGDEMFPDMPRTADEALDI